jgi:hypothetical protein
MGTLGNFAKLKEKLFQLCGPGHQSNPFVETYHWYEKKFSMFLIYDRILEKGVIGYTFLPIYRERREDKKLQMVNSWLALLTDMGRAVITDHPAFWLWTGGCPYGGVRRGMPWPNPGKDSSNRSRGHRKTSRDQQKERERNGGYNLNLGFAYTRFPFKYMEEFRLYEREARESKKGVI